MGDAHWSPPDIAAFALAGVVILGLVLAGAVAGDRRRAAEAEQAQAAIFNNLRAKMMDGCPNLFASSDLSAYACRMPGEPAPEGFPVHLAIEAR